jgi:hypothetical protein
MANIRMPATLLALLIGCTTVAKAEQTESKATATEASDPASEPAPAAQQATNPYIASPNDGKWHFSTIGYGWLAGATGKVGIGRLPAADLDLTFFDALDVFKFAFMGAAEARHDRLVFLGDAYWIHLGVDKGITVRDTEFVSAELDSKTGAVTALGGYRVLQRTDGIVDLLAGARINLFNNRLEVTGPTRTLSDRVKDVWVDPIIATRSIIPLGEKVSMTLYGDVGGFGIGSDITFQAVGTLNYRINRKMNAGVGWRYEKINYDKNGLDYDVAQSGPFIALRTDF